MNKQKLKSWMLTQTFPLVVSVFENNYYGGKTYTSANPQGYDIYPDAYTAQHEVARANWDDYIESFPEFIDAPVPKQVSLAESLGEAPIEALLPRTAPRKRTKA